MGWEIVGADEAGLLTAVRAELKNIKIPGYGDRVRKAECVLSFDSPESPEGLFVNLSTFQGYGVDHLEQDSAKSVCKLYLNIRWKKIPKPTPPPEEAAAPTKLAIGVEGGFNTEEEQFDYEKINYLAVFPSKVLVALPNTELPELVGMVVDGVLKSSDFSADEAQVMAWEEKRLESKYAKDLVQVDNGKKISPDPSTWKCEESGIKEGLWLNLSDGHIGSGRQQVGANGEMTGGTGAALKHYQECKARGDNFCLCVKLGTITPHGADVYSYAADEDDMVEDPLLKQHLAHWGINMMSMEKTEKSMAELQIDLNVKFDFDKICESGQQLQPLCGPGFVGLKNLGNSCYMNSILQLLFTMPEIKERYYDAAARILSNAPSTGAADDLTVQMAKLAVGLLSDRYCPKGSETAAISPQMFKFLVGKGHPEFSTGNQQDAYEYLQHLLKNLERSERTSGQESTQKVFEIVTEVKLKDLQSGKVRYTKQVDGIALTMQINTGNAENAAEVTSYEERNAKRQKSEAGAGGGDEDKEEPVKPLILLEKCLDSYFSPTHVDDYVSPVTGSKGVAEKRIGIKYFPKYLVLHMGRYTYGEDWRPKKLDCLIPAPETLDMSKYRSMGEQPGEELLPEEAPAAAAAAAAGPQPDMAIVESLMGMGFGENACKRAAVAVSNAGVEAAIEWAFAHNEDQDFNDPLPAPGGAPAAAGGVDEASVEMLMAMGFQKPHAAKALKETGGNLERAADWLMSRMDTLDQLDVMDVDEPVPLSADVPPPKDHSPKYQLMGFVSHIGPNTGCGHYVCHIKKEGRWTIFNDGKVAVSEKPPLDLGFLYIYQSID